MKLPDKKDISRRGTTSFSSLGRHKWLIKIWQFDDTPQYGAEMVLYAPVGSHIISSYYGSYERLGRLVEDAASPSWESLVNGLCAQAFVWYAKKHELTEQDVFEILVAANKKYDEREEVLYLEKSMEHLHPSIVQNCRAARCLK